ncbi:MAG: MCE family protein [Spirochaetales bacterium]|nr:MCE family protein [Spirochaetales bacterium]
MRFRIRFAQQVVGFFLLLALAILVGVIILMGLNQRWFDRGYHFTSRFETADGLTPGMPIHLRGFEIGKVSSVDLNSNNRVNVVIQIYSDYYDKIKPNSVLELDKGTFGIGGGLNLLPGRNLLPPMENGSFIPSTDTILGKNLLAQGLVDQPTSNDQLGAILAQVQTTLGNINQLLGDVNAAVEGTSSNQLTTLLAGINLTVRDLNRLLAESSQGLVPNLTAITGDLAKLSSQLRDPKGLIPKLLDPQGSIATMLNDHNQLYNQVTTILSQISQTMTQVQGVASYVNQSTPQITGVLEDTRTALHNADNVMTGLANNPLLKGGIPEQKPQHFQAPGLRDEKF